MSKKIEYWIEAPETGSKDRFSVMVVDHAKEDEVALCFHAEDTTDIWQRMQIFLPEIDEEE